MNQARSRSAPSAHHVVAVDEARLPRLVGRFEFPKVLLALGDLDQARLPARRQVVDDVVVGGIDRVELRLRPPGPVAGFLQRRGGEPDPG